MEIAIAEARRLSVRVLRSRGLPEDGANIVTDHLIDAHCTGHTYAGLPRLVVLLDRIESIPEADRGETRIVSEAECSAWLDGGGNLGYITCQRAIEIGMRKAASAPIVVVGAFNSHYSGRLGYYTSQAARSGLVALHASSAFPMVAPPGGDRAVLGTNPICASFPTTKNPVTCDLNTAALTRGAVDLAAHIGAPIPAGTAIDRSGLPTTDPREALAGALLPWGGHKGFAISILVAALGILAGGDPVPAEFGNWGYLFVLVRPDAFLPPGEFEKRMDELTATIKESSGDARVPGERSAVLREESRARGTIDVPDDVLATLGAIDAAARARSPGASTSEAATPAPRRAHD